MSTPRYIALAIRACKPVKISNPTAQVRRRFLATSQNFREASQIDIKAGFPQVPASKDEGRPQSTIPRATDASPKLNATKAAEDEPQSVVSIDLAKYPEADKESRDRRLIVNYTRPITRLQLRELFADFEHERIRYWRHTALVTLKTAEEAQRAISTLSGQQLPPPARKEILEQKPEESNTEQTAQQSKTSTDQSAAPPTEDADERPRLPRNIVAAYHKPLRVEPHLGVRVASLQLRSYSVRNLEFMCDFALRAAYFLGLPASGPVPLPKKIERWTMPRSNFVHKKSQENFERITRRRAIQIIDGHKDVVQIWLAYLRKHQFYGVGMKADVWEFEGMDVAGSMDRQFQEVEKELDENLSMFGWNKHVAGDQSLMEQLNSMGPAQQTGVSMQYIREDSRSESRI